MRTSFLTVLVAVCVASALGCGTAGAGSCTVNSGSYCVNFTGSAYTTSAVQAACPADAGTYSAGTCPSAGGGLCTFAGGTTAEYKWVFPTPDAGSGSDDAGAGTTEPDGGNPIQASCAGSGGVYSTH
jgi:hypothetical protein